MNASLEEWKSALITLPAQQRAELAHYLLHTLDDAEADAGAEWLALAQRRMEDVRAGKAAGIPAEQVLESLRERRR
ncbi:MAG TPA: addiction module protein [Gemmataceae bacterium]|nr:addiction module protein [Gemmataceae bacterium]